MKEITEVTWNGRARVNEDHITPEQYKMFFGRYEFGISFDFANSILASPELGDVVPCDELNEDAINQIKDEIRDGYMSGTIEYEGQTLDWIWDPELTDQNGETLEFNELDIWTQNKILEDMLDYECKWGSIDC